MADKEVCGSAAVFARNGDRDLEIVYRCTLPLGHKGDHGDRSLRWSRDYPDQPQERLADVERRMCERAHVDPSAHG